jgi:hypothetical protein
MPEGYIALRSGGGLQIGIGAGAPWCAVPAGYGVIAGSEELERYGVVAPIGEPSPAAHTVELALQSEVKERNVPSFTEEPPHAVHLLVRDSRLMDDMGSGRVDSGWDIGSMCPDGIGHDGTGQDDPGDQDAT